MQDAKEEVRARLAIEDVIGEYVQLKRAGRNYKGLSPFTNEKSPSFVVSPDKQIWHDFSSGRGGDVFSFVMLVEGLEFRQALEQLARRAGVELAQYSGQNSGEFAKKKQKLLEVSEAATHFYQHSLVRSETALAYLRQRGLSKQSIQDFRLGYAPESGQAAVDYLTKKGFSKQEIKDAGLTNRFGGDLFRGRLLVPLMDPGGQTIGFTGRIIVDDPKAPKYLNTPQTLLYDKSRHVFGLSQAKEVIRKHDYSVLVEGNLDVVSTHQAGTKQVVATAGTALTLHQLKALGRLSSTVKLAFDTDDAGLAATERAIPIAQNANVTLQIISLPEGVKDPDELVQKSVEEWQSAIETAQPVVDWVITEHAKRADMSSAAGKRDFTTSTLQVIGALSDAVEREHYMQQVAQMVDVSLESLQQKLGATGESPIRYKQTKIHEPLSRESTIGQLEQAVLAGGMINDDARKLIIDADDKLFIGEEAQAVYTYWQTHQDDALTDVPTELQNIATYVKLGALYAETRYGQWNDQDITTETARLLRKLQTANKQTRKNIVLQELRDAEQAGDEEKAKAARTELHELIKEMSRG